MTADMLCPRCSVEMTPAGVKGLDDLTPHEKSNIKNLSSDNLQGKLFPEVRIFQCHSCKGQLFHPEDIKKIENIYEVKLIEFRKIPDKETQYEPIHCPVCKNKRIMAKVQHERDAKVIMDICYECKSIWLDGGELEAIQEESLVSILAMAITWVMSP